jgi:transcriptional regulator with XRE-family HTH domain
MAIANGHAIKALREAKHMTTSDLARKAGLTRQHVGRIQMGFRDASNRSIELLAAALEVEVEAIGYGPVGASK